MSFQNNDTLDTNILVNNTKIFFLHEVLMKLLLHLQNNFKHLPSINIFIFLTYGKKEALILCIFEFWLNTYVN